MNAEKDYDGCYKQFVSCLKTFPKFANIVIMNLTADECKSLDNLKKCVEHTSAYCDKFGILIKPLVEKFGKTFCTTDQIEDSSELSIIWVVLLIIIILGILLVIYLYLKRYVLPFRNL